MTMKKLITLAALALSSTALFAQSYTYRINLVGAEEGQIKPAYGVMSNVFQANPVMGETMQLFTIESAVLVEEQNLRSALAEVGVNELTFVREEND
jgi:hypothetical protein